MTGGMEMVLIVITTLAFLGFIVISLIAWHEHLSTTGDF